jgi:CRISPR system Cascade subunit CasC
MLIEIHILQNHSPSNLNRDDTGSPKECVFAGVRRARISSQCLKRSIRRSELFQTTLEGHLATRTRQLPELIKEAFEKEEAFKPFAEIAAKKATGFGTKEAKEQDPKNGKFLTKQTMFLAQSDIDAVTEILKAAAQGKSVKDFEKISAKELQAQAISKGFRSISMDIGLFGRMVTSEAIRDVEAACQVAHAISTHKVDQEFDYFTAVDDLQGRNDAEGEEDSGADMIGDVEFNSACYYKYFSVDVDALVDNLVGRNLREKVDDNEVKTARDLACKAILSMLEAAVRVTPSGKQNTFASHTLPSAVLVEVRPTKTPVSYANAFANPVQSSSSTGGLVNKSVQALCTHAQQITTAFSLQAKSRYWFAPEHQFQVENKTELAKPTSQDTLQTLLDSLRKEICE